MHDFLIRPQNMPAHTVTAFFATRQVTDDMKVLASYVGIGPQNVYLPIQEHTDVVQIIDADLTPHIADAVVTHRTGLLIGVKTADCVPVLLYDEKRRVVGALHAGWRGSAQVILTKALAVLTDHFYSNPVDILVALGPAICSDCYEVGPEVIEGVVKATGPGDYFSKRGSKYHIDLRAANRLQALAFGIPAAKIWMTADCTCCQSEKYYSYRYARGSTGRLYSMIVQKK
ncbi:MAG TPA: peptidoglycan editing factor PgeF [Dissulfurispiraceae bacterium]|nr:peptidoglycan editing factor PgeF [Dissulfurispiraceae bacterium]